MIAEVLLDGAGESIVIAFLGFFGGIFTMYYGFVMHKRYQLIRDTPTSKIQSVPVGTVELKGSVESAGDEHLYKHPLDEKDCVYYMRKVEQYNPDDDGSNWDTVLEESVGDEFYLNDGTGKVLVKVEDPDFDLEGDARTVEKTTYDPNSEEVPRYLRGVESVRRGVQDSSIVPDFLEGNEKYRITVEAIWPDMDLYVFGYARTRDGEQSFAKNEKNVEIGSAEKADSSTSGMPLLGTSQPFIIANQDEEKLVTERKWLGPVSFFGGLAVSAGCLWYLLFIFGV